MIDLDCNLGGGGGGGGEEGWGERARFTFLLTAIWKFLTVVYRTAIDPQLVKQRPWYVLCCLWDDAYKSSPCGGSGFPLSLSEWSFTICLTPYKAKKQTKTNPCPKIALHLFFILFFIFKFPARKRAVTFAIV